MTRIIDITPPEFIGAASQWQAFIRDRRGFDRQARAEVHFHGDRTGSVMLVGYDEFQNSVDYHKQIGQLGYSSESFKVEDSWEDLQCAVWERLRNKMARDERELRFGVQQLGQMIEGFSMESEIGKMLHQRLVALRDEMSGGLLEYQRRKQAGPSFVGEAEDD